MLRVLRIAALWAAMTGLSWSPAGFAFGPSGHRVAGHVADRHLCRETRAALAPLLAGRTLAEAGLWPDTIRRQPEWEHTKPWHFINVADRDAVARVARSGADNVLAALARYEQQLGDPALAAGQRAIALRFVVHFVADIHQPLHVGRAADRGGNLIPVLVAGRATNLHALWDGEALRPAGGASPRDWARSLPRPSAGEVRRWQRAGPVDWARESQALRQAVYAFERTRDPGPDAGQGPGPGGAPAVLTAAYVAEARSTIERRLVQAGVRLAGRLNRLLGPPGGCAGKVASSGPTL